MQRGAPVGSLQFALDLHGATSEECAMAEPSNCPSDTVAFYFGDGTVWGTHEAVHAFRLGFTKSLDLTACEFAPAKPLPSSIHPSQVSTGWTIRHDKCIVLLGSASGPSDFCFHETELDRAERPTAQLLPIQSLATALVLLHFFPVGAKSAATRERCRRTVSTFAPT